MECYGCSITQKTQAELENNWIKKLTQVNSRLAEADTLQQYLALLQNEAQWNSLSFCLRRYVYEHITGRGRNQQPVAYSVRLGKKIYHFSPVVPGSSLSPQERDDYADLLYKLTVSNHCFAVTRAGQLDPKRGLLSKKHYQLYLDNQGIGRSSLFSLSMCLRFDTQDMNDFMNAVGESPVYNFRSAVECIYYFCHSVPQFRTIAVVRELLAAYLKGSAQDTRPQRDQAGGTRKLQYGIDQLVQRNTPMTTP